MSAPRIATMGLDAYIKLMEEKLEIAVKALKEINSPLCPQRQFRAEYALVELRNLDESA